MSKISIIKDKQNQILQSVQNRVDNFGSLSFFGVPILRTNRNSFLDRKNMPKKCFFRQVLQRHFWGLLWSEFELHLINACYENLRIFSWSMECLKNSAYYTFQLIYNVFLNILQNNGNLQDTRQNGHCFFTKLSFSDCLSAQLIFNYRCFTCLCSRKLINNWAFINFRVEVPEVISAEQRCFIVLKFFSADFFSSETLDFQRWTALIQRWFILNQLKFTHVDETIKIWYRSQKC